MASTNTLISATSITDTPRLVGRVKWFNSKAGYGFITVSDGFSQSSQDIFVYYKSLSVNDSHYKYLVQGEYVDFDLVKSVNESHEFHADSVTGVRAGLLMCQTQNAIPRAPTNVSSQHRPFVARLPSMRRMPNSETNSAHAVKVTDSVPAQTSVPVPTQSQKVKSVKKKPTV